LVFDPETQKIKAYCTVLVNGRPYQLLQNRLDAKLREGDVVAILPPFGEGLLRFPMAEG